MEFLSLSPLKKIIGFAFLDGLTSDKFLLNLSKKTIRLLHPIRLKLLWLLKGWKVKNVHASCNFSEIYLLYRIIKGLCRKP